jgi:hypothetical protein
MRATRGQCGEHVSAATPRELQLVLPTSPCKFGEWKRWVREKWEVRVKE